MMLKELREQVLNANIDLVKFGLVTLTWGNVSGISRENGFVAIKPSGIDYDVMKAEDIVIVDFDGKVVDGTLRPSSDTPTHIELYKSFPKIGGITHTHSIYGTIFAQARKEIPCFGTTHADYFYGEIPVTRMLTENEVVEAYELNTGKVIVERFAKLQTLSVPGVLVAGHAPFAWGKNAEDSVKNSLILESVAKMAYGTLALRPNADQLPDYVVEKHYLRKHGPDAYYGQK